MRMNRLRIAGVVGASAVLLGSASGAMAAQQPATSATLPVIVILKSQLTAAPAGSAASSHRMAESSADQSPLISAAAALGAKNVRQYQLVNSFAATVSPQALTGLEANPSVAEVIPNVTIHGDLSGTDPEPTGPASAGRTSATSAAPSAWRIATSGIAPTPCTSRRSHAGFHR